MKVEGKLGEKETGKGKEWGRGKEENVKNMVKFHDVLEINCLYITQKYEQWNKTMNMSNENIKKD